MKQATEPPPLIRSAILPLSEVSNQDCGRHAPASQRQVLLQLDSLVIFPQKLKVAFYALVFEQKLC